MGTQRVKIYQEPKAIEKKKVKEIKEVEQVKEVKKVKSVRSAKTRGKKWQAAKKLIQAEKAYSISSALELIKKISYTNFDAKVEVHIRLKLKKGQTIRGKLSLPHNLNKEPKTIEYKSDWENLHQIIGKVSWENKKLADNFKALIEAVRQYHPLSVTICSTMSPGIRVELTKNKFLI